MEGLNRSAFGSGRKLLEGERVEVRQKEKGLRGSWHSGVVVHVKNGRRVVEYDELLTLDGLNKLRESIPLHEDIRSQPSALRERNGSPAERSNRGFIRSKPPPCLLPAPENWTKGLLVDAFYDDAWWEGILLDDVRSGYENEKVRILFPEEGDDLRTSLRSVRLSQDWDEATGRWALRGHWAVFNENGAVDFNSLKQMWRQTRSSLKELWRQKRCDGRVESWKEEQKLDSRSQSNGDLCRGVKEADSSGNVDQGKIPLAGRENSSVLVDGNGATLMAQQWSESDRSGSPLSEDGQLPSVRNNSFLDQPLPRAKDHSDFRTLILPSQTGNEVVTPLTSGKQRDGLNVSLSQARLRSEAAFCQVATREKRTILNQYFKKKPERRKGSEKRKSALTRKSAKARLRGIDNARVRLTRSSLVLHQSSGRQNSQDTTAGHKLHRGVEGGRTENTSDGSKQSEKKSDDFCPRTGTALLSHYLGSNEVQEIDSRGDEASLLENSNEVRTLVKHARLSAKKFLLDAGWKVEFRVRSSHKSHSRIWKKEPVYVSPSGSRYFSLASACRAWKKLQNLSICFREGTSMVSKLLNTYNIAESFMHLRKPYTRQVKPEKFVSAAMVMGESLESSHNFTKIPQDINPPDLLSGRRNIGSLRQSGSHCALHEGELGFKNSLSVIEESSVQGSRVKRSVLTPCVQKVNKRKHSELDSSCPTESMCKRSKTTVKKTNPLPDCKAGRHRGGCRMQALLAPPGRTKDSSFAQDSAEPSHFRKSTVLSWLIDKGVLIENESVCYLSRKDGHVMKKGQVTREGVLCNCCKDVSTLSNFELHAGSKLHRPSANIFLTDGRPISECQMQACALQDAKEKKEGFIDSSDDTCGVCGDGGELILCDHCPSTFHADCIGLQVIPEGDWYCPRCSCGACGVNQLVGDVNKTMLRCAQCELEYHLACVNVHGILKSDRASRKTWFCGRQCEEIFTGLRGRVGISNSIDKGLSWMLLRSMKRDHGITPSSFEVIAEHNSKLSVAHGVMQECFVPMIDPRTKIDLISQALYNRRSKVTRLNYSGFYTMLLERGDEVISVATIRIHGARLAEMPLVGTRYQYRRQGMCRRLVHAIEEMLMSIGVEKLILPAVPELLETWIGAFGFHHMNASDTRELSKLNLMTFPGTTLLQKHLKINVHDLGTSMPIDRSSYKFEGGFPATVDTSLGLVACLTNPPNGALERTPNFSKTFMIEKTERLDKSHHSCVESFIDLQDGLQPFLQDGQHTPAVVEIIEGHLNASLSRGRLKGRNKCKSHCEGLNDDLGVGKETNDDDFYNTKVVITTTRSKRLVKSSRWVADGLKELVKDVKQSKRNLGMESDLPKTFLSQVAESIERGLLVEEYHPKNDGQGNGRIIENVYVRTRRKAVPPVVQVEEGKDIQRVLDFSATDSRSKPVVTSDPLESGTCSNDMANFRSNDDELTYLVANSRDDVDRNWSFGHEYNVLDEALDSGLNGGSGGNGCGDHIHRDSYFSNQAAKDGLSAGTKYYSRRKKKERRDDTALDNARGECEVTAVQTVGSSSQYQPSTGTLIRGEINMDVSVSQEYVEQVLDNRPTSIVVGTHSSSCEIPVFVPATMKGQGVHYAELHCG